MIATCPKCDRTWETRSTREMICCPSCQRKFPRPAPSVEVLGKHVPLNSTCDWCGRLMKELNVCRVDGEAALVCETCIRQQK